MSLKRIGFVDYDLNNFHADTYLRIIREELAPKGFAVTGCCAKREAQGKDWAKMNQVNYYSNVAELDKEVDYYLVLAPGNPELHLELCKAVFPFGKTTYVDKIFAPDYITARKIFALADKNKTEIQTSSALRYTEVQGYVKSIGGQSKVKHMVVWGGGRSFAEYAIHPVEMVVSSMGAGVEKIMRRGSGKYSQLLLEFSGGRSAVINVYINADTPFAASVTTSKQTTFINVDGGKIFISMAEAILDLFDRGRPDIKREESLVIRKILDKACDAKALRGFVGL